MEPKGIHPGDYYTSKYGFEIIDMGDRDGTIIQLKPNHVRAEYFEDYGDGYCNYVVLKEKEETHTGLIERLEEIVRLDVEDDRCVDAAKFILEYFKQNPGKWDDE